LLGADAIEANRTVGGFSWHPDLKAAKALLEAIEPEIAEHSAISALACGGRSNARIRALTLFLAAIAHYGYSPGVSACALAPAQRPRSAMLRS